MQSDNERDVPLTHASAAMAPPEKPQDAHKIDISTLMSPPDPIHDSFSNPAMRVNYTTVKPMTENAHGLSSNKDIRQPLPMSPPISPYSQPIAPAEPTSLSPPSQTVKDPVLYPHDDSHNSASPTHSSLFAPISIPTEDKRIVDDHIRNRSPSIFSSGVHPPKPEDYALVLNFKSQVLKHFTTNRKGWLRQERAFLKADQSAVGYKRYHRIMPAKSATAKSAARSNRLDQRSSKPSTAPRPIRANGHGGSTSVIKLAKRAPATTPDPTRRIVAPNREDKDFQALLDLAPPLDTLPNKPNSLKVEWRGAPLDLSDDPFAHLLHPDERSLAAGLRLDCATYLTSKRRMFIRRLQCIGIGKEFRKTDAQQACKIDVNKASKLWQAFDKVGWLDQKWMKPHMNKLKELEN
ncbi:SWIRM domain-containing protein [Sarocladium implicatum]|nr:SWIRM domain-containing protein [Sarocladium implicatum]